MTKQKEVSMREQLTTLVADMRKDGFSFVDTPPVFEWRYEEMPEIQFKLLITESPIEVPEGEVVQ